MKSRAVLRTRTNESKSCPSEGSPSEVRAEARLSLGSPSGCAHSTSARKTLKACIDGSHGCSSEVRVEVHFYCVLQIAALGVISNIVVNFTTPKSAFMQCGGVKELVRLSKLMESTVRVNAVGVLRNLMFLKDHRCKEGIFLELTASTLTSLICDDGLILHAVGRQLQTASNTEALIQGMYVLSNVASGNEFHKEAVMQQLFPQMGNDTQSIMIKLLQSNDGQLCMAAVWVVVNLTFPSSPGAYDRVVKLRNGGVISQLKNMVNDPCLDVKLRVRTVMGQFMTFGDSST